MFPTADQALRMDRDGVAVWHQVFPQDHLSGLRAEFNGIMAASDRGRAGVRSPLARSMAMCELAESAAMRRLVEPILGPTAFIARSLLFDKHRAANWDVAWHRDTTIAVRERIDVPGFGPWSVKSGVHHVRPPVRVLANMLTVRLHLDDCDESNGALLVVPGSHAARHLDLAGPIDAVDCERRCVACSVPGGGALLMRPLILHASKRTVAPARRRRVLHLEFAASMLEGGLRWFEERAGLA